MGCNPILKQLHCGQWELCRKSHRSVDADAWCKPALTYKHQAPFVEAARLKTENCRSTNFYKDVNLWTRIQLGHYCCVKSLLEVHGHLYRLPVSSGSSLSLTGAERGHAILTINQCLVVQCLALASPYLKCEKVNNSLQTQHSTCEFQNFPNRCMKVTKLLKNILWPLLRGFSSLTNKSCQKNVKKRCQMSIARPWGGGGVHPPPKKYLTQWGSHNFYVTYESDHNWSQTYFMNFLRIYEEEQFLWKNIDL